MLCNLFSGDPTGLPGGRAVPLTEEVGVVAAVVGLVSEADLRREGRTGDAETVASATILTGWNVTSVRQPSQMSLSLHRPTPWRTRGMR